MPEAGAGASQAGQPGIAHAAAAQVKASKIVEPYMKDKYRREGKGRRCCLMDGIEAIAILHQDNLKKKMNRITATWRKGCIGKRIICSHHIKQQPYQIGCSPKTLF